MNRERCDDGVCERFGKVGVRPRTSLPRCGQVSAFYPSIPSRTYGNGMIARNLKSAFLMAFVEARQQLNSSASSTCHLRFSIIRPLPKCCCAHYALTWMHCAKELYRLHRRTYADAARQRWESKSSPPWDSSVSSNAQFCVCNRQTARKGHRRERAGRDLWRKGFPCGIFLRSRMFPGWTWWTSFPTVSPKRAPGKPAEENPETRVEPRKNGALGLPQNLNQQALVADRPAYRPRQGTGRCDQTLCRRQEQPRLVQEAGVGKTAIAEGLAHTCIIERAGCRKCWRIPRYLALDMGRCWRGPSIAAISANA